MESILPVNLGSFKDSKLYELMSFPFEIKIMKSWNFVGYNQLIILAYSFLFIDGFDILLFVSIIY